MLLLSNWINKMMEMKDCCGTVKKMNQSWSSATSFVPGLFNFFFFFTLTVTHLSVSLNSWRCLFPCVSNKETIIEKQAKKQVWSHTHKKTPLKLDYTSSKNQRTTTRPTSQAPFDPWLTSVCPIQYSPDHYIVHTLPNPSIHKALTSELRRWYGIKRTFLDSFFDTLL